ncbi:MAG TPA: tetratricopeptide repeat protein [Kofleriaceae bacterium]|nr:tetratricopeptide repeat protein [Kofleriaceae bacterium]
MASDSRRITDTAPGVARDATQVEDEPTRTRPGVAPPPLPPIPTAAASAQRPATIPPPRSGTVPPPTASRPAPLPPPVRPPPLATPPPLPNRRPRTEPTVVGDVFAVRGVRSPLVGRDAELAEMGEVVSRAVDFHTPQLITVIGNQGTGKSRLIAELCEKHARPPVRVFNGRATPEGPRYGAIQRLLRHRFGIDADIASDAVLARFTAEVERVFDDKRVSEVRHFLGQFVDLMVPDIHTPESPFLRVLAENAEQLDEITRTVLRRFIEEDAKHGPLVLVFEDLQWADDDTLQVLRELGNGLGGSAVVLIVATRPDLLVRFSDWGSASTDHTRIDLRNLEPDDAATMLENLLGRCDVVPPDIIDSAVEMTGGNPHFLEQLVRLFLDNGTIDASREPWRLDADKAAETELPISIEEAIQGRIAALEQEERDALEKGAVFGNVFWSGAVVALTRIEAAAAADKAGATGLARRVAGQDHAELDWTEAGEPMRKRVIEVLEDLVESDYLLRLDAEDSTIVGDTELVFKHNLERELIAKSTEPKKLARYHRLAAQWLETKLSARSEEQLEFLAQLYERGGEPHRAAHCYLAGADKARARYANDPAVELYKKALARLGDDDPVARLDALHNYGSVLDLIGRTDEAHRQFSEMLRVAWLFDQRGKGGAAHSRLGRIYRRRGEYDRAMEHLRAAHELFTRASDRRGIAGTLDDIGKVHWLRGAYGQALEFHRQALAIRRALDDRRSIALSLANIGRVHNDSGAFKAACRQFREALDLRRDINDLPGVVQSLCDLGGVHTADGAYEMALEMFGEAHRIAEEIGDKLAQSEVLSRLGECKAAMGRGTEAVEHLLEAISLATQLAHKAAVSECCRRLAEVYIVMGDAAQAYDYAMRALAISEEVGTRVHVGTAHRVLAEAIASAGDTPDQVRRAEEHFRHAVEILAGMKNELELARCYRSFAGLCDRIGKPEDATKLRTRADEIFGRLRGAASVE